MTCGAPTSVRYSIKAWISRWRRNWPDTARLPQPSARQGIRGISYDAQTGDFLILIGRSISTGDEPFQLCTWNGSTDSVRLLDVTFTRSMKPEGVVAFSSDGRRRILIVDDAGGHAVFDHPESPATP